jgi:hypothetical protein
MRVSGLAQRFFFGGLSMNLRDHAPILNMPFAKVNGFLGRNAKTASFRLHLAACS